MDFMKKKPGESQMSPMEQEAKLSVLGGMQQDSEKDMLSKLQGLGKPDVAIEIAEKDPVEELCEGKSAEELQAIIDQLMEKKSALEQSPAPAEDSEKVEL